MAQGMKKHTKGHAKDKRRVKKVPKVKKGARDIAPKKTIRIQEITIKKAVVQGINTNIVEALDKAMVNDHRKFSIVKNALCEEKEKRVPKKEAAAAAKGERVGLMDQV